MCICDDLYFKLTNMRTGEHKTYKRAASIARRFGVSKDLVMYVHHHSSNLCLHHNGVAFRVTKNEHQECRELRRKIVEHFNRRPAYLTEYQIKMFENYFDERGL